MDRSGSTALRNVFRRPNSKVPRGIEIDEFPEIEEAEDIRVHLLDLSIISMARVLALLYKPTQILFTHLFIEISPSTTLTTQHICEFVLSTPNGKELRYQKHYKV